MNPCSQTSSTLRPGAHLLIHAGTRPAVGQTRFQATLRRLRLLYPHDVRNTDSGLMRVQINDLQGQQVFGVESAETLLDIPLPAGTYHVIVQRGKVRRSYTMAIEPGTSFDLYLRLKSQLR